MANKRPTPEAIVTRLRQIDVLVGQGKTRIDAIRSIGVVEQTYYRWRKLDHSMGADHKINPNRDSFVHGQLLSLVVPKPQFWHLDAFGKSRPQHQKRRLH